MFSKYLDQKAYADKARSVLFNLRDPRNPMLRQNVLSDEITPADLVHKDPKELANERLKEDREKL